MIIIVCIAWYSPLKFILYPLVLFCECIHEWDMLWCVCMLTLSTCYDVYAYLIFHLSCHLWVVNTLHTHHCNIVKKIAYCNLFTDQALRSSLAETCPCVPDRIEIWKCWFLRRGENWSTWRKISRRKGENQKQTQPTYGVDAKIPTWVTLVGGECSDHCASLATQVLSWVWMLHCTFTCYDLYALLLSELWFLCMVSISSCFSVTMNVDFHIISSVFVFFFWKYTCNHG